MDPCEEVIDQLEGHLERERRVIFSLQAQVRNLQRTHQEEIEDLVGENQQLRAGQMQLQDEISHLKEAQQDPSIGGFERKTPDEKVEYFRKKATAMQQLAYQFEAEKKSVVLENWQLKQENQLLRDENSELKLPKPLASRQDDEMEPRPTLEERLDHIERRLSDLEEWRCARISNRE